MKISQLLPNTRNPRLIKDEKFRKLVESIKRDPEFMETHQIGVKDGVIMAGNMRYKALIELGYKEVPDNWIVDISSWPEDKIKRYVVVDNLGYGEWDWDIISSDYDVDELSMLGFDDYILKLKNNDDMDKLWEGMPEFDGKDKAFKSVIMHFDTQDDVDQFAKLIGQSISDKTKFLWYPQKNKEDIRAMEVIEDE